MTATGNEESSTLLQQQVEYSYEEEETLSLSDLPIYSSGSNSARWGGGDDFSKEDGKSFGDDNDNLFEFFSEEFTTSTTSYATAENIIFCGKLIPFKDSNPSSRAGQAERVIKVQKGIVANKHSSKGTSKSSTASSCGEYKVSLVRSTTKSRWFLFMFGMSKLSTTTEMELRDIRNRQSRRRRGPTAMIPAAPEALKEKRSRCKGVWKMLNSISLVFSCHSSKIADNVVKAAFV